MALKIADVSHWQGSISWSNTGLDAVIIKCGGGDAGLYTDPMFAQNKAGARRSNILCGFYYFAGHGDPTAEADYFLKIINNDIQQGELLALDAETGQSPLWCKTFLDRVSSQVGFKPLIYCPSNNGWDWSPVVKGDYGLWYARYHWLYSVTKNPPIKCWPFYAIYQYSSTGKVPGIAGNVDMDYTKMDLSTLKKYGKK